MSGEELRAALDSDETREVLEQIVLEAKDARHTEAQRIERIAALAALAAPSTPEPSGLREALSRVDEALSLHVVGRLGPTGVSAALLAAQAALRAAPSTPEPSAEDGRPPLPPETVAYDKAFMDGYLAAKRDYSPGGMYAAPSTPEPSGLPPTAQAVLDSWPEAGLVVSREQARVLMEGARIPDFGAAPSTEPALDVERLAELMFHFGIDVRKNMTPPSALPWAVEHRQEWAHWCGEAASAILARLAESQS